MYKDQGGEKIFIQDIPVYLPPVPAKEDILGFDLPKKQQKWENVRTEIPMFKARYLKIFSGEEYGPDELLSYEQARREEIIGKSGYDPERLIIAGNPKEVKGVKANINYFCTTLNRFRKREMDRLRDGIWFYNCGKPTYLTGFAYFFFTYWPTDIGPAIYKEYYREWAYLIEVALHDPEKFGLIVGSVRGIGKTTFAASACFFYTSRKSNAFSGIQSKSDKDAADLLLKRLVIPAQKLPDFLMPINNAGLVPPKERFEMFPPGRRHPNTKYDKYVRDMARMSAIEHRNSSDSAFDSETCYILLEDEIGKVEKPNDVEKRWEIIRPCVERNDYKSGIILGFTTAGEMEKGGGKKFKKIWDEANINNVNELGRTSNGCIRMFISKLDSSELDEYGRPQPEKALKKHNIIANQKREISEAKYYMYLRNNPLKPADMFNFVDKECQYSVDILQSRINFLSDPDHKKPYHEGMFEWIEKDKKAKFVEQKGGFWHASWQFPDFDQANKFVFVDRRPAFANGKEEKTSFFSPLNGHNFSAALDPVGIDDPKDEGKKSMVACSIICKGTFSSDLYMDMVADYNGRHDNTDDDYEQIIMAACYYGCPVLIERQAPMAMSYFRRRGYDVLLPLKKYGDVTFIKNSPLLLNTTVTAQDLWDGNQKNPGVSANTRSISSYVSATRTYVMLYGHKLKHIRVAEDWLEFDPTKPRIYDSAVAASWCVLDTEEMINEVPEGKVIDLKAAFKTYDHSN